MLLRWGEYMRVKIGKIYKKRVYEYKDIIVDGVKDWDIKYRWGYRNPVPDVSKDEGKGKIYITIKKKLVK